MPVSVYCARRKPEEAAVSIYYARRKPEEAAVSVYCARSEADQAPASPRRSLPPQTTKEGALKQGREAKLISGA
jgi:hypothetical protein